MSTTNLRRWLRTSLRRHAYAAGALPLAVARVVAAPFGAGRAVDGWRRSLAGRFLGVRPSPRTGGILRTLAALPIDLVAFALVVPAWAVFAARGVLYPLFGASNLESSWGGPSLPGAWFAHFIQGPPLLLLVTIALAPLVRLQTRQAAPMQNSLPSGSWRVAQ